MKIWIPLSQGAGKLAGVQRKLPNLCPILRVSVLGWDRPKGVLDAYRQQELYTYCAIVLSDIGIHYDGWSPQEFRIS